MPAHFSEIQIENPYLSIASNNRYIKKHGKVQLPIASPQGFQGIPVAIVQLCAEHGGRIFSWSVSRQGAHPEMPHSKTNEVNEELCYEDVVLEAPNSMATTGVGVWSASGVFVYMFKKPVNFSSNPELMWFPGVPFWAAGQDTMVSRSEDIKEKLWQQK